MAAAIWPRPTWATASFRHGSADQGARSIADRASLSAWRQWSRPRRCRSAPARCCRAGRRGPAPRVRGRRSRRRCACRGSDDRARTVAGDGERGKDRDQEQRGQFPVPVDRAVQGIGGEARRRRRRRRAIESGRPRRSRREENEDEKGQTRPARLRASVSTYRLCASWTLRFASRTALLGSIARRTCRHRFRARDERCRRPRRLASSSASVVGQLEEAAVEVRRLSNTARSLKECQAVPCDRRGRAEAGRRPSPATDARTRGRAQTAAETSASGCHRASMTSRRARRPRRVRSARSG